MNITDIIQELEQRLKDYIDTINVHSLEYTPFIVGVGALTVGTDENGVIIMENKNFPTQFSEKAVKEICSMTFRDGKNAIIQPIVYGKHEWYLEKIESIKFSLEELKKYAA